MRTKRTAESFDFPERFGAATSSELPGEEDALVELASDSETRCSTLFGNKTQSQPYHTLIVAVATLVENRFPGVAVVTGDLSRRDGQDACDLLQRALHEDFRPPVVLDAARMRDRLLPVLG
ncbi:MAG TPA: hypothetical protein VJN18_35525, partial [Polyangiaceae bacterium]|nr:hypothetical protein [Polyangiaceae bacterium]